MVYISFAVYQTVEEQKRKLRAPLQNLNDLTVEESLLYSTDNSLRTTTVKHQLKPPEPPDRLDQNEALKDRKLKGHRRWVKDDELQNVHGLRSWQFQRTYHWPELFSFYHINFNKR